MLLIMVIAFLATRRVRLIPRGIQNLMEMLFEALLGLFESAMGPHQARKYFPLLATFFIFIIISNYSGLLPGAGVLTGFMPPTSNWSITAGLAIIVFFSVHYFGLREGGTAYLKHFIQPSPVLLPLNVLEEFVKPLSLSLRLFGNIFGEELLLAVFLGMIPFLVPIPIMALSLLFGFIQAFVFTLLAAIYISSATEAGHH
ncbi:MAG: F0F1 ATP synthase subunit A [Firmicutes bacterium]|nr:F0F1 ATP synthase subunit A [Bacillota bacterium]